MNIDMYDMIPIKTKKHIKFDLSKNEIYIIENRESLVLKLSTYSSENMPSITIFTSLLFFINTILAYLNKYYVYAGLFGFLTITSLLFRLYTSNYTYFIDKIAVNLVIAYGAYVLYQNINTISKTYLAAIVSTFVATILLYYYGYKKECFCYDKDNCIAENYMALLHIFSAIGHSMIISIPGISI